MFGSAPTWLIVVEILLFTLGAVAYAVVLVASRSPIHRQVMARVGGSAGTAIAALSIVWCVINVAGGVLALTGTPGGVEFLVLFAVTAYLYPPLIIDDVLAGDVHKARLSGRAWQAVRTGTWMASLGLSLFLIGLYFGWWRIRIEGTFVSLSIGSLFVVAMGVGLVASRVRRTAVDARPVRPEARWVTRLFVLALALSLVLLLTATDLRNASYLTSLVTRLLPLAFLVAGAYAEGRAAFYDLVVKRMVLAVLAMSILAVAFLALRPVVAGLTPALAAVLASVVLGPLAIAFASLSRVVSSWLDARWLGRHFTPGEAIEQLLTATGTAERETDVTTAALPVIGTLFDADVRLVPTGNSVPRALHVVTMPFSAAESIEVTRRDPSRRFYSEDLALMQSVVRVLGLEVDRMQLVQARQAEEARTQHLQLAQTQAELRALRAQINPHFLFNALTAIGGWTQADPRRAESVMEQLADVFRYTLRGTRTEWVTLGAELDAVRTYLDVEQARFGTRLSIDVVCDDHLRELLIPPLVVLTLAENAIKHGVADSIGSARVRVQVSCDDDDLRVEVIDTGGGLDDDWQLPVGSGGFGLASVRERLHLLCGTTASLEGARDEAAGCTRFILRLPQRHHTTVQ